MERIKQIFTESKSGEKINKKLVCELWDGTKIYIVSGAEVRNNVYTEFIGGGHSHEEVKYVPKGEIWIEEQKTPEDQVFILAHELMEWMQMKYYGEKYKHSHDIANSCEKALRTMAKFASKQN